MPLVKQHERQALTAWWAYTGRHILNGVLTVLIPFVVIVGLFLGFTIN